MKKLFICCLAALSLVGLTACGETKLTPEEKEAKIESLQEGTFKKGAFEAKFSASVSIDYSLSGFGEKETADGKMELEGKALCDGENYYIKATTTISGDGDYFGEEGKETAEIYILKKYGTYIAYEFYDGKLDSQEVISVDDIFDDYLSSVTDIVGFGDLDVTDLDEEDLDLLVFKSGSISLNEKKVNEMLKDEGVDDLYDINIKKAQVTFDKDNAITGLGLDASMNMNEKAYGFALKMDAGVKCDASIKYGSQKISIPKECEEFTSETAEYVMDNVAVKAKKALQNYSNNTTNLPSGVTNVNGSISITGKALKDLGIIDFDLSESVVFTLDTVKNTYTCTESFEAIGFEFDADFWGGTIYFYAYEK